MKPQHFEVLDEKLTSSVQETQSNKEANQIEMFGMEDEKDCQTSKNKNDNEDDE